MLTDNPRIPTPHEPTEPESFATMLARLNKLSVERHHGAFEDVSWDEPGYEVWNIENLLHTPDFDPMPDTDWYKGLTELEKARFACYRVASFMKIGWQFENILQQGLLRLATRQENGARAFRYLHHEIIEESQHTLMFQEFVDRSGLPVKGMPWFWRTFGPSFVIAHTSAEPAMFFTFVLAGEEPVDYIQRSWLKQDIKHPLIEQITRIHVTEEARHISFARHFLHTEVPKMGRVRRHALALQVPIVLGIMTPIMLKPPPDLRRHVGLPNEVVQEAFRSDKGRHLLANSVAKIQRQIEDLDLMTPASAQIWKAANLWTER